MDSADRDSARKSEFPFTCFTRLILVARSRSLPSINIDFIETSSKRVQQRNDFKSHEKETRSINWKFQSFFPLEKLSNYQSLSLSFFFSFQNSFLFNFDSEHRFHNFSPFNRPNKHRSLIHQQFSPILITQPYSSIAKHSPHTCTFKLSESLSRKKNEKKRK